MSLFRGVGGSARCIPKYDSRTPPTVPEPRSDNRIPVWSAAEAGNLRISDVRDASTRKALAECREHTREMEVPQFPNRECEVRVLWDITKEHVQADLADPQRDLDGPGRVTIVRAAEIACYLKAQALAICQTLQFATSRT